MRSWKVAGHLVIDSTHRGVARAASLTGGLEASGRLEAVVDATALSSANEVWIIADDREC